MRNERFSPAQQEMSLSLGSSVQDLGVRLCGEFQITLQDAKTGEILYDYKKSNIITYDAGILAASLFRNPLGPANGAYMLAVGTGATGNLLSPDAPDPRQRKLNAELARKPFANTVFRAANGTAVAYWTNVVDFTTTFNESEAVGPITEMGLLSPVSQNPLVLNPNPNAFPTRDTTLDLSLYDVLINYSTIPVVSKTNTSILTVTWRISF